MFFYSSIIGKELKLLLSSSSRKLLKYSSPFLDVATDTPDIVPALASSTPFSFVIYSPLESSYPVISPNINTDS